MGLDAAVLRELDRFARRVLEPTVGRPEKPMDVAALTHALHEARDFGLLSESEPSGLGIWEELDAGAAPTATLAVLGRLARVNPGFAFALHQRALSRVVSRRAGWEGDLAIAPEGSTRLGRVSFARLFAGAPLDADDRAVLADVFAPDATRVIPFGAEGLVTPVLVDDALELQWHTRDDLRIELRAHAHGLDELNTTMVSARAAPRGRVAIDTAPIFAAHQLGLLAIAAGAVEHGHALARRFASERRQGGVTIDHHPAVLALLAKTRATLDTTRAQLSSFGALDATALFAAMSFRAESTLADAAHASLQVFGGLGYMRDTGLEKIARDVNHLRAMAGSPPELALIAAEWERLHD